MFYRGNYEGRGNSNRGRGRGENRGRGGNRGGNRFDYSTNRNSQYSTNNQTNQFKIYSETEINKSSRNPSQQKSDLNERESRNSTISKNFRGNNNFHRKPLNPDEAGYLPRNKSLSFFEITNLLNKMVEENYCDNISLKLLDKLTNFEIFLNNEKNIDLFAIKTILKVIIKANENKIMEKNFRELLTIVLRSQFAKKRLDHYISTEINNNFDLDMLKLLIIFFKLNFEIIPGIAYDVFYNRICNLKYIIDSFQLSTNYITSEIINEFQELKEMADACNIPSLLKPTLKIKNFIDDIEPPDDFRNISIFPSSEDLIEVKSKEVFLRRNKSYGTYKSVDDYLDVQFRLMREDFIHPLREGLNSYKSRDNKKHSEIRVYINVKVINSLPAERLGIIHNLQFDKSRLKKINWIQSKRFLYGSLLCLSSDNFKTLLFATIVNREIKDLENGIISVKFYNSKPTNDKYTLIETTNMFESYKHVLLKLQETNDENLSMKKYLVYADNNIDLPKYLNSNKNFEYQFKSKKIWPGDKTKEWPRGVELDLDESQFQAFQSALTKEISIVQGPPGTGKTYLGLNICECLLTNVQTKFVGFGPILIVCYTNHALDQFLEGILNFTDKIVRIGNRSKSEKLQPYSILNWKKKCPSKEYSRLKWTIYGKLRELKDQLLSRQAALKVSREHLISLDKLKIFINKNQFNYLKMIGLKNWLYGDSITNNAYIFEKLHDTIIEWLMYEEIIHNVHQIVIDAQTEILNEVEKFYVEDMDNEVTFINDQRKLDIDDDDVSNVNEEFNRVLLSYRDYDEPLIQENDGFTLVKNKTTRRLFQSRLLKEDKMSPEMATQIDHLDLLTIQDRWSLYRYWRSIYSESLQKASTEIEIEYESLVKQVNEIYFEEDRSIMKIQNIIGMTTTGAARYSKVLSEIGCKIIIVEEAAEVLESHIVASLNLGCQHLILIGDHKQLKPNPAVFELAKRFELDISLFERLINNKLHYNTLLLQHRMRPEIAEIMQFIYKDLQNHESVLNYSNVPSVEKNLYFINHNEEEKSTEDIMSYSNPYEAEFIVKFCRHLMKNGVERKQMTILTLYSGQMFLFRRLMDKHIFEGVRVCVVDNYQGEENDIILLSLVRSNEHQKIGFLSIENRICVSLSRAKQGLYVFGNFHILANQNEKWKEICNYLKGRDMLSKNLLLLCQNHPEKKLIITKPNDFDNYPEGGCEELCSQRLGCGHACRKACHFLDKNHENNKCMERCTRLCVNKHRCNLKCWQTCKPCYIKVEKVIQPCNHLQLIECSKSPEVNDCTNQCERKLYCGHTCLRLCKDKCGKCLTDVEKVSPSCEHLGIYKCFDTDIICTKACNAVLGCDHKCEGTCGKCYQERLHETCNSKCTSQLVCGHACLSKCSLYCPPCPKLCEEGCLHNVCPRICGEECISCFEKCKWRCKHQKCSKLCYEICDRNVCNESCDKLLDCESCKKRFKCYGICGEPCRKICLNCDPEIKEIFFGTEDDIDCKYITLWTCSHSFEVNSMDNYMNNISENGEIVAKRCPKCNSIINKRSCFRYLNIVKRISENIKEVQRRIIGSVDTANFPDYLKKLDFRWTKILEIFTVFNIKNYFDCDEKLSNFKLLSFNTSLDLIYEIHQRCFSKDKHYKSDYINNCILQLITWLNPNKRKFNEFEINQFNAEYNRIDMMIKINKEYHRNPLKELENFTDELKQIKFFGESAIDFNRRWDEFYRLKMFIPNMEITEYQRKEIVKAIGLGKGRWFKCPQGHFYVIDQCGGATQISKCPECQSSIGGTNHQLLGDNHFAPEMDLAEQPAWPGMRNN